MNKRQQRAAACSTFYLGREIDNGVWKIYFGPLKLGRLLEKHMRIEDANGKLKRRTARS